MKSVECPPVPVNTTAIDIYCMKLSKDQAGASSCRHLSVSYARRATSFSLLRMRLLLFEQPDILNLKIVIHAPSLSSIVIIVADHITKAISRFLYETGLSFKTVSSACFKEMMRCCNPAYVNNGFLPGEKVFRTRLLDEMYEECKSTVGEFFEENQRLRTIGADGYTTDAGSETFNIGETIGDKTFFMKTHPNTSEKAGIDYYTKILSDFMEERAGNIGSTVEETYAGFIGDNCSTNIGVFRELQKKYPKLVCTGCFPHILSLLAKDIIKIPDIKTITDSVKVDIVKYVRRHGRMKWLYTSIKGSTQLLLYPDTRFSYVYLMLDSVVRNRKYLLELIEDGSFEAIRSDIKVQSKGGAVDGKVLTESLSSNSFWSTIESLNEVLSIIHHATSIAEGQSTKSRHVHVIMNQVFFDVGEWATKPSTRAALGGTAILAIVRKNLERWTVDTRKQKAYQTHHYVSYILNPYTMIDTSNFDTKREEVIEFLKRFVDDKVPRLEMESDIDLFLSRNGPGSKRMKRMHVAMTQKLGNVTGLKRIETMIKWEKKLTDPYIFWIGTGASYYKSIFEVAKRLMTLSCQNASIERICKANSHIHTKTRNRLKSQRVQKLLYIYHNSRCLSDYLTPNVTDFDQILDDVAALDIDDAIDLDVVDDVGEFDSDDTESAMEL